MLEENLLRFIDATNIDYSLLLSGGWGCGKTFYLKNTLKEIIEKRKLKYVYISIYGMKTIDQIIRKLVYHCFLDIKGIKINPASIDMILDSVSKVPKIGNYVSGASTLIKGLDIKIKNTIDFSKIIIIIDDLERISNPLEIDEVIGTIYREFVEGENSKIIFVANEIEIINKYKDKYSRIKEKVIRRTILFDIELQKQIENYINTKCDICAIKNKLLDIEHLIIFYFEINNTSNLRVLGLIIDSIKILNSFKKNYDISRYEDIFITSIIVNCIEYSSGNITSTNYFQYADHNFIHRQYYDYTESKDEHKNKNKFVEYYEKYLLSKKESFFFLKSTVSLIIHGVIDVKDLENDLSLLHGPEVNLGDVELDKIINYSKYSEKEIVESFNKIQNYIVKDFYNVFKLPYIFSVISFLVHKLNVKYDSSIIYETILTKIDSYDTIKTSFLDKETFKFNKFSNGTDAQYDRIIKCLETKLISVENDETKTVISSFLDNIGQVSDDEFYVIYNNIRSMNYIEIIVTTKQYLNLYEMSNLAINRLTSMIQSKYVKISNANEVYRSELPYLHQLRKLLIELFNEKGINNLSYDGYFKMKLISTISEAINNMEK